MSRWRGILLGTLVAAALALVAAGLWQGGAPAPDPGGTVPFRAVDREAYLRRVGEGTLSDREALWWQPAEEPAAP